MRKLFDRTPAEASVILQTLKAVATAEGLLPFDPVHQTTLEGLRQHVLRARVDLDDLPVTLPNEIERRVLDPEVRANLLHLSVALPLLEAEYQHDRGRVVRRLAERFRASEHDVESAERTARRHYTMLALDAYRGSRADVGRSSFARSVALYLRGLVHRDADPELAARVHAFAAHPEGTVGRALLDYWRDNELGIPGEPGAMHSRMLFKHDVHHVLTGYDTTPRGELALAGFYSGAGGQGYGGSTALLFLQLQIAVQADPTLSTWRAEFDPRAYVAAVERGECCTEDVVALDWDPWSVVERPLAEVRSELGIADDGAMVRGPGDRWCGALGPRVPRAALDDLEEARI